LLASFGTSIAVRPSSASVISTTDTTAIAAFKSGRIQLDFDELVVPAGPCYLPLDPNQYAAIGIIITARADGSAQTNLARLPGCGDFGATLSAPNIIGGGTGPGSLGWRESVRFDFSPPANAFGANSDWTGSNTTLTAYNSVGGVIASVSGNQGNFMGIAEPGIAYAIWNWNYDQAVAGFSLDNLVFSNAVTGVESQPLTGLVQATPNPFLSETWIQWSASAGGRVHASVYDLSGQRVATLLDEIRPSGVGLVRWGGTNERGARVPAGIYFVRLELPDRSVSRRVVRIR